MRIRLFTRTQGWLGLLSFLVGLLVLGGALPASARPGEPLTIRLVLTNPTSEPMSPVPEIALSIRSGDGTLWTAKTPWQGADEEGRAGPALPLPPRSHRVTSIDLAALAWSSASDPSREVRLGDIGSNQSLEVRARSVAVADEPILESNPVRVWITPP